MTGFTMRCAVCGISWPHHPTFRVCELCGYDTEPLAALEDDHVLTMREADELLIERGVKEPPPPGGIMSSNYRPRVSSMRQPQPANPGAPELVRRFHDELDRWAKEAPSWLKR